MNPYDTPKTDPDWINHSIKRNSTPSVVKFSIIGIALSISSGIAKIIYVAYQRGTFRLDKIGSMVAVVIGICIIIAVIYLLLKGLYNGSKIAFWFVIVYTTLTVIAFRSSISQFSAFRNQWEKALFLLQGIIQLLSAAALLFPQSRSFFYKRSQDTQ